MAQNHFDYIEAFSRNIGWLTEDEQLILRGKKVALAGMGGVGGAHLLTLARLGIGSFSVSDSDIFELANFNRQAGATLASIGESKVDHMVELARDINPEIDFTIFREGVHEGNLNEFLDGADVYVDSLDFFALDIRRRVFQKCHELGIPAITAAPIGMGVAFLIFRPGGMTFDQWFRLDGLSEINRYVNFSLGLAPTGFHRGYLIDMSRVDFAHKRIPSLGLACDLCAGAVAAQVIKLVFHRGEVRAAPWYHHFDAYRNRWKKGFLPGGNANPLQRIKLFFAYRFIEKIQRSIKNTVKFDRAIERILDRARWAPSADNTQPWRFRIMNDTRVVVMISKERQDFQARVLSGLLPYIHAGMLIEAMRIAAIEEGYELSYSFSDGQDTLSLDIRFNQIFDETIKKNPRAHSLLPYIRERTVRRESYRMTPLTSVQKKALVDSAGSDLSIQWYEDFTARFQIVRLNMAASLIRYRLREVFESLKTIIDWHNRYSPTGIPAICTNLGFLERLILRLQMKSWRVTYIVNTWLGGILVSLLKLDLMPGLRCAAHVVITLRKNERNPENLIRAGENLYRFWLTAQSYGLSLQPGYGPLAFSGVRADTGLAPVFLRRSAILAKNLEETTQATCDQIVFMGRIGSAFGKPKGRSVRRDLGSLLMKECSNPDSDFKGF